MDLPESEVHSFIVKLWFESEGWPARWRGHVTHVPGGERRDLRELDEIVDFVEPYLEQRGVPTGRCLRLRRWLRRRI